MDWQREFSRRSEQDHREMVVHLAEIQTKQDLTNDVLRDNNEMLRNLMAMMQTVRFAS